MSELVELVRHPQLYLPFVGTGRVIAGAGTALAAFCAVVLYEPAAWPWTAWQPPPVCAVSALAICGLAVPLLAPAARLLRRFEPHGDPHQDAASLGPLAMQLVYGVIARAERQQRRAAAAR